MTEIAYSKDQSKQKIDEKLSNIDEDDDQSDKYKEPKNKSSHMIHDSSESDSDSDTIPTLLDMDISNFQIENDLSKNDGSPTEIYLISDKSDPEIKYYAETVHCSHDSDSEGQIFHAEKKKLLACNHAALTKYSYFSSTDFDNKLNPVLFSSYYSNGFLNNPNLIEKIDNTNTLIIIFGIAAGMTYLHSRGFYNCDLLIENIQLDDFLFPKISFYGLSTLESIGSFGYNCNTIKQTYKSIEMIDYEDKKSICLFSFIVYELITKKKLFPSLNGKLIFGFNNGKRPTISNKIPECYKQLIENCWSSDISSRPSFEEIVNELLTNQDFLIGVDKKKFKKYRNIIYKYDKLEDKKLNFDEYLQKRKNRRFNRFFPSQKVVNSNNSDDSDDDDEERNKLDVKYVDLSKYSIQNKIGEGLFGEVFLVESNEKVCVAKISKKKINKKAEKSVNIYREASIISQLDHPCILKFIGYNNKNFDNENKPVILTEFTPNRSLYQLFEFLEKCENIKEWNETQKLIVIYGLVSCMAYVHSKNIIHRDLKPSNILLDIHLLPKLANFCFSSLPENFGDLSKDVIIGAHGNPKYFAPEIFEKEEYSKASDVYSFALILYEIITGEKPFSGNNYIQIMNKVIKGERPTISDYIPNCYKNLIEKCWSQDPKDRMTFDQIITELKTNKEFIQKVDQKIFAEYVEYVENRTKTIHLNKVDLQRIYNEHKKRLTVDSSVQIINLDRYVLKKFVGEGNFGVVYQIQNKKDDSIHVAKISKESIDDIEISELICLYREVNINAKLNHPCIMKFIGYSPFDFEKLNKPVIITEIYSKGTLKNALKLERCGLSLSNWDNTTKLINIYGIAAGLSYLHYLNILHRDLKPDNILLDENLYPKIADFGLSKEFSENDKQVPNPQYQFKGTPVYCSPEILGQNLYTKAGDIYAFGLIVYEIITNDVPFSNIENMIVLFTEVVLNKSRPKFNYPIPDCYRNLIESCWDNDPKKRPKIDAIVDQLKNDPSFLEIGVDEDDFNNFVSDVDEFINDAKCKNKVKKISSSSSDDDDDEEIKDTKPMKESAEETNVETLKSKKKPEISEKESDDTVTEKAPINIKKIRKLINQAAKSKKMKRDES